LPLVAQLWLAGQSLMANLVWVSTSVMQFFWYLMRLQAVWSIFSSAQKYEPGEGMQKIYECPYAQFFQVELVVKLLCKTLM
jgi:hypothetical protein